MRRRLIAGNWKMHGSPSMVDGLVRGLLNGLPATADIESGHEMAVFPPFPLISQVRELAAASPLVWGAQTVSEHAPGAYTGEVSADMLTALDCTYVLVGHSERRTLFAEDDAQVAAKFTAAMHEGLLPVLCVGETLEQREAGATESVVGGQIDAVLEVVGVAGFEDAVIAYEPVWAIGTGRTATPDQAQSVHAFIRGKFRAEDDRIGGQLRILYGGSMKPANAAELLAMEDIDGGLIGGASLTAEDFLGIYRAS